MKTRCLHKNLLSLFSSTSSKKSYHFIHANPTVLFENTKTLGLFINTIFQTLLFAVANHKCLYMNSIIDSNSYTTSIKTLISLLSPYITQIRANCSNCMLLNNEISAADIAYLLVCNKKQEWLLIVDLHVYSRNQQFRTYDAIKTGLNNPLITTNDFPFQQTKSHSYFDILNKSLITNTINIHVPLILLENEYLFNSQTASKLTFEPIDIKNNFRQSDNRKSSKISLHDIPNLLSSYEQRKKTTSNLQIEPVPMFTDVIFNDYLPFVNTIITHDDKHRGRIQSCVRGNRNTNKLFFNISGHYRYCPKIAAHHHKNSTTIIIDISNDTYAIRCKDPYCDNTYLTWHHIHKP